MECVATDSALVLRVATPPLSVPVPRVVAPSLNVTLPVGVPAPGATGETVAVTVTDCPDTDGLAEDVSVVVVPCRTVNSVWVRKCVASFAIVSFHGPALELENSGQGLVSYLVWSFQLLAPLSLGTYSR